MQGRLNGKGKEKRKDKRGRSRKSYSERMWGKQAEYFSASPKERGLKRKKQAELFRRNVRRTSRIF